MRNLPTFIIVAAAIFFSGASLSAQQKATDNPNDSLTTRLLAEVPFYDTCTIVWFNAQCLVPDFYNRGQFDSMEAVMTIVNSVCEQDKFDTLNILRQIGSGQLPDDWYNDEFESTLLDAPEYDMWHSPLKWSDRCTDKYEALLDALATKQTETVDSTSMAHIFCQHYLGNDWYIMNRLRDGGYPGTPIQREYDRRLEGVEYELRNRKHLAAGLGIWVPTGKADLLGTKAEVGIEAGLRRDWYGIDGTLLVRFFESREYYEVYYNERLVPTDKFTGGYIGVNLVGEVMRSKRYNLELFAGGGYDGFTALSGEDDFNVNSHNLNVGFTVRRFFNETFNKFYGLRVRYNIVDYDTGGGSDLSGNTISISVLFGYLGNPRVTGRAQHLLYYR